MRNKIKNFFTIIVVIALLPYVCTVLVTGEINLLGSWNQERETGTGVTVKMDDIEQTIDIEEYLAGILPGQISVTYELEALKAQAVIARGRIYSQLEEDQKTIFEEPYMSLETLKKTFGEAQYLEYYEKMKQAVKQTEGLVPTYDGQVRNLPTHAVSAGLTRSGREVFSSDEYPYLVSVESEKDLEADGYIKLEEWNPQEIVAACREEIESLEVSEESDISLIEQIEILERDSSAYVKKIKVGNVRMSGELFRSCLGLNSSCFTLQAQDGKIRIITKGLGHGVGMSQYGANRMAESGSGWEAILEYYYPDIELQNLL